MKLLQHIAQPKHWHPVLSITLKFFALFAAIRLTFYISHLEQFQPFDLQQFINAFVFGASLDAMAIFYTLSAILLLLHLFRLPKVFLVVLSLLALVYTTLSTIDLLYFSFSKERLGAELLWQMEGDNNISIATYITDYLPWFLGILVFVSLFTLWLSKSLTRERLTNRSGWTTFAVILCTFLIARGGWRSKPMRSTDIGQYVESPYTLLGINTPVYLYESGLHPIEIPSEVAALQPTLQPRAFVQSANQPLNVVVIVLESFGKEYTGQNGGVAPSYTPNLDTLALRGVTCTHGYANGLKSLDAVPAIFSGIPKVNSTSFIHSPQSTKPLPSIYKSLREYGYHTSFFHGGNNNTMGFQSYLKNQGLEHYYGQDEMRHIPNSHDGHWGIYDHAAFQFLADKLDEFPEPFVSGIFTLSSHHPYPIPKTYQGKFPKGTHPIHETVGYTDLALGDFFANICTKPWFERTIFVITADHSAINSTPTYLTPSGKYEIPIIIYAPQILEPTIIYKSVSQMDIFPTILELTGVNKPTLFLGESILNTASSGVIHFDNNAYHYTDSNWVVGIANKELKSLYNKTNDVNCTANLLSQNEAKAVQMKRALYLQLRNYEELLRQTHN